MGCRCGGSRWSPPVGQQAPNGTRTQTVRNRGELLPGSVWNGPKAKATDPGASEPSTPSK